MLGDDLIRDLGITNMNRIILNEGNETMNDCTILGISFSEADARVKK